MAAYLIIHDTAAMTPGSTPANIPSLLAGTDILQVTRTNYLVSTTLQARDLFQRFEAVLTPGERVYVLPVSRGYWGVGRSDVWAWLQEKMP